VWGETAAATVAVSSVEAWVSLPATNEEQARHFLRLALLRVYGILRLLTIDISAIRHLLSCIAEFGLPGNL